MLTLLRQHHSTKLHQCCYGLSLPSSDQLIRESTRLLLSDAYVQSLGVTCPGKSHPSHAQHDVVAGSAPVVGSVNAFAARYPPQLARALLETVPRFAEETALQNFWWKTRCQ